MEKKTILVLGANGKTGSRVIERLEKISGIQIRKGSRNEKVPLIGKILKPGNHYLRVSIPFILLFSLIGNSFSCRNNY
ncbi:hypothetical protein [Flavobacterium sp.]|uniref:hypothetical protein n=1 Tax=Flavobacterium sp. TaxID=239 RepID=UPI0032630797